MKLKKRQNDTANDVQSAILGWVRQLFPGAMEVTDSDIIEMLAAIRLLCDRQDLDYGALDKEAYQCYLTQKTQK